MKDDFCDAISRACDRCSLKGGCCRDARPPLTKERIDILMAAGVSEDAIEFAGYSRLKVGPDGYCVLFKDKRCSVHSIKPETCVAGPFTFDMKESTLQIFLKRPEICPMVDLLRGDREIYEWLLEVAINSIVDLVRALPGEELEEVLKIEEPLTDLVAEIGLTDSGTCS